MTITLLSQENYDTLKSIQEKHPKLTFQNNGYEYIRKSELSEEDLQALSKVESILKETVEGFAKFFNFRINKNQEIVLRFDYNYSPIFTGVGYVTLRELKNGFDPEK